MRWLAPAAVLVLALLLAGCSGPAGTDTPTRPVQTTPAPAAVTMMTGLEAAAVAVRQAGSGSAVLGAVAYVDEAGRSPLWTVWVQKGTTVHTGIVRGATPPIAPLQAHALAGLRGMAPDGLADSPVAVAGRGEGWLELVVRDGATWLWHGNGTGGRSVALDAATGAVTAAPRDLSFAEARQIVGANATRWAGDARLAYAMAIEQFSYRTWAASALPVAEAVPVRFDGSPADGRSGTWLLQYVSPARARVATFLAEEGRSVLVRDTAMGAFQGNAGQVPADGAWADSTDLGPPSGPGFTYLLDTAQGRWTLTHWIGDSGHAAAYDARTGAPA